MNAYDYAERRDFEEDQWWWNQDLEMQQRQEYEANQEADWEMGK